MTSWEPYALVAAIGLGTYMQQAAFQAGDLAQSLPAVQVLEPVVAVILGISLLQEELQANGLEWALIALAAVAMIVSTAALARSQAEAQTEAPRSPRRPPPADARASTGSSPRSTTSSVAGPSARRDGRPAARAAARGLGRTLEIGAGTGANLPHYPELPALILVEPDGAMRRRLAPRAAAARFPVEVLDAPPSACRSRTRAWTWSSRPGCCARSTTPRALAEARRVLRPGGRLLFIEHVRAEGRAARWQDRLARLAAPERQVPPQPRHARGDPQRGSRSRPCGASTTSPPLPGSGRSWRASRSRRPTGLSRGAPRLVRAGDGRWEPVRRLLAAAVAPDHLPDRARDHAADPLRERGSAARRHPRRDPHPPPRLRHRHHLVAGFLEFRFQPEAPWFELLAIAFGIGAGLMLDEFALPST